MDYDYIKEEYLSDDEYYYEEKRRNLAFQNILDEEEIVRKSLGKVPSRKLSKGNYFNFLKIVLNYAIEK